MTTTSIVGRTMPHQRQPDPHNGMPMIRPRHGEIMPENCTWNLDREVAEDHASAVRHLVYFYNYPVERVTVEEVGTLASGRVYGYAIRVWLGDAPSDRPHDPTARAQTQNARAFIRTYPAGPDLLVAGLRLVALEPGRLHTAVDLWPIAPLASAPSL